MSKIKLDVSKEFRYFYRGATPAVGWAIKSEKDPDLRTVLGQLEKCKDYLHETMRDYSSSIDHSIKTGEPSKLPTPDVSTTRIALIFCRETPEEVQTLKKNLLSIKKVVNVIEKKAGWKKSVMSKVDLILHEKNQSMKGETVAFLFTGDSRYTMNMPALHSVLFFLRALNPIAHKLVEHTPTELVALIEQLQSRDPKVADSIKLWENCSDRSYIEAMKKSLSGYLSILMKNHDKVFEGLTYKDVYDVVKGSGNYHSGFGLSALHEGSIYNTELRKRFDKLLKENPV